MKKRNRILRIRLLVVSIVTITLLTSLTAQAGFLDWFRSDGATAAQADDGSFNVLSALVMGAPQDDHDQPVLIGNAVAPANSPVGGVTKTIRRTYFVQVSAYNSEEAQTDASPFIGAMGTHVRDGMVAANMLPFGTAIKFKNCGGIDPNKIFVVEDRMNKRYQNNVDIWFASHSVAVKFGRRPCQIEVIR